MIFIAGASLFILFAYSRAFLRYRDKVISIRELFFWTFIWVGAALIILYPPFSQRLASELGIARGSDAILYISIIIIFYLVFRSYVIIGIQSQEITRLVRAIALHESEKAEKKGE